MGIKLSPKMPLEEKKQDVREDSDEQRSPLHKPKSQKRNEIITLLFFALALFFFLSFLTYDPNDLSLFSSSPNRPPRDFFGIVGAYVGGVCLLIMGLSAYSIPILITFWAIARFAGAKLEHYYFKFFGTIFLILAVSSSFSLIPGISESLRFRMGGMVGVFFSGFLTRYLGIIGAVITISVLFMLSLLIATDFLIFPFLAALFKKATNKGIKITKEITSAKPAIVITKDAFKTPKIRTSIPPAQKIQPADEKRAMIQEKIASIDKKINELKPIVNEKRALSQEHAKPEAPVETGVSPEPMTEKPKPFKLPPTDLLNSPPPVEAREIKDDLQENSRILEEILGDFEIEAKVIEVNRGPVITRYELEPGAGVKIHRITSLSDNIALGMKAQSVRIVAPVPGKGTVGVEVPNSKGLLVFLREIIESREYIEEESALKLALGKDIAGEPVITDLAGMPHLLIAGATGSGKTVCVNSIIMSILFNATPDEVRFIMVDPKKVELAPFNNIPHLLSPVVTDYKKVPVALDWLVQEMEKRYELFAKCGVRNISFYNKKAGEENWKPLYYIIVIIDELADLMMVAQQEIESAITRLAQLSRAVGIHMILATQRPSVDVITGVIKANFPARISFKVASKVDSRTVLDINGAEKLLGKGDMLIVEPGNDKPVRAQGSLVLDDEIERTVSYVKLQRDPSYEEEVVKTTKKQGPGSRFQKDEIYEEAVRVVLETKQASVSMLQRKLGVGYTKAARLIDMMEDDGIVGPYQGSKPRDILVENLSSLEGQEEQKTA